MADKSFSHQRKSLFKKKKKKGTDSPHDSRSSSPADDKESLTVQPPKSSSDDKKKSPVFFKKSFKKVAKAVKIGRSMSKDRDKTSTEEVDGEASGGEATPTQEDNKEGQEEASSPPKRPTTIPIQTSPTATGGPGSAGEERSPTSTPSATQEPQ